MSNKTWLRLYTEITRDRKLRRLDPVYRWVWITILCMAKESPMPGALLLSEGVPVTADDIADEAAVSTEEVNYALQKFEELFIENFSGKSKVIFVKLPSCFIHLKIAPLLFPNAQSEKLPQF